MGLKKTPKAPEDLPPGVRKVTTAAGSIFYELVAAFTTLTYDLTFGGRLGFTRRARRATMSFSTQGTQPEPASASSPPGSSSSPPVVGPPIDDEMPALVAGKYQPFAR